MEKMRHASSLVTSQEWMPRRRPDWKKIMIPLAQRLIQRNGIPLVLSPKAWIESLTDVYLKHILYVLLIFLRNKKQKEDVQFRMVSHMFFLMQIDFFEESFRLGFMQPTWIHAAPGDETCNVRVDELHLHQGEKNMHVTRHVGSWFWWMDGPGREVCMMFMVTVGFFVLGLVLCHQAF